MFRCERREYSWVSSSKEIVCCQLRTPCFSENKNTKKLIQNTQKCCLLHATNVRLSNYCGWRRISKSRRARFFFYAPNQEKCPIIPRFLPESLVTDEHDKIECRLGALHSLPASVTRWWQICLQGVETLDTQENQSKVFSSCHASLWVRFCGELGRYAWARSTATGRKDKISLSDLYSYGVSNM